MHIYICMHAASVVCVCVCVCHRAARPQENTVVRNTTQNKRAGAEVCHPEGKESLLTPSTLTDDIILMHCTPQEGKEPNTNIHHSPVFLLARRKCCWEC